MNKKTATLIFLLLVSVSVTAEETCFDLLDEDTQGFIESDEEAMAAFEGTQLGEPHYVFEVNQKEDYYLIPCNKEGGTTAVIKLDAKEGYFEAVTWMEQPTKYLPIAKSKAVETIKAIINPKPTKGLTIEFSFNGEVETNLEWQAGEYSQDPFKPYWILKVEDGKWIITQQNQVYEILPITSNKSDTNVTETESVSESTKGFLVAGKFYEITNNDLNNGSFEATLTFTYLDENQDGTVDNSSIKEKELNVYFFDTKTMQWVIVPNPTIDTEANTIRITANHFTIFMLAVPEPGPEPEPENQGGGTWMSSGNPSGSGGTVNLGMEIEENCAGKKIIITILNPSNNPAENATVTIYTPTWKTVKEQKTNKEGKTVFVLETGEYTIRVEKSGYMVNTKQITVEECKQEKTIEEPEVQNNNTLQENQTETKETQTQEQQNLEQIKKEQETTIQTGLFSLEGNEERTTTAAIAGIFVAMLVGAVLYVKKRVKKKQN